MVFDDGVLGVIRSDGFGVYIHAYMHTQEQALQDTGILFKLQRIPSTDSSATTVKEPPTKGVNMKCSSKIGTIPKASSIR
jgi:hypothetical protein